MNKFIFLFLLALPACAKPIHSPKVEELLQGSDNAWRTTVTATYPRRFLQWSYPSDLGAIVFTVEVSKTIPPQWQFMASTTNRSVEIWVTNGSEFYRVGARMP